MKLFSIKKEEWSKVILCWLMLFLIFVGCAIGWAATMSIFAIRIGVQYLPYSYMFTSIFSIIYAITNALYADRLRRDHQFYIYLFATIFVFAINIVTSSFLQGTAMTITFLIFMHIIYGLTHSQLVLNAWVIIHDLFSPSQGVRAFPILGTAALLGYIIGGWITRMLAEPLGSMNLPLLWLATLIVEIPIMIIISVKYSNDLTVKGEKKEKESYIDNMLKGFRYCKNSKLLINLAFIYICFWFVASILDYQYMKIMSLAFPEEDQLSAFFGLYSIIFNVSSLIIQFFIASRIIKYIGAVKGFIVQPIITTFGFLSMLLTFSFWSGLMTRYFTDIVGMSLQTNAIQLTFNAIPSRFRGRARSFIDGLIAPTGGFISGLFILIVNLFVHSSSTYRDYESYIMSAFGLTCAIIYIVISRPIHRRYMNAVIKNIDDEDRDTQKNAIEALEERRDQRAIPTLFTVFEKNDDEFTDCALEVLSKLNSVRSVPFMVEAVENHKPYAHRFFPLLIDFAEKHPEDLRQYVKRLLECISESSFYHENSDEIIELKSKLSTKNQ